MKGKDLINIGIFSAIYFAILFIIAMLGMIPIFLPLLSVLVPIIGGIPFMLFLTKVRKFGMIWIMSILMGILMLISGMSWYALAIGVFSGLIADLIFKSGNYGSSVKGVLSHAVLSLWIFGNYLLFYLNHESYMKTREEMVGKEYGMVTLAEWYENAILYGIVALFFLNSNPLSIVGAIVAILCVWFLEILIDNTSARVKWQLMLKLAWGVTIIAAGMNLFLLEIIRG